MSSDRRSVSVIVNNYNYGRFLGDAIDSALAQTYTPLEVLVVDDGSTDESREVIASYGDRIIPVLKENGGQASAFNAGYATSQGDAVIFVDADDALLPRAAELAVEQLKPGVSKVHWPLWRADQNLESTGLQIPAEELPFGDLREITMRDGKKNAMARKAMVRDRRFAVELWRHCRPSQFGKDPTPTQPRDLAERIQLGAH